MGQYLPLVGFNRIQPGKAEKRNQKAERLSDRIERSAFSAFDFQLSAFPLSGTGKAEKRNQKAERLSDHVERSAFSAFDFQLSAFPLIGAGAMDWCARGAD